MSKLPSIQASVAIKAFEKAGFYQSSADGSHRTLRKEGYRFILTVPVHGSKPLKRGTLRGLIRAAGLSVDEFLKLL